MAGVWCWLTGAQRAGAGGDDCLGAQSDEVRCGRAMELLPVWVGSSGLGEVRVRRQAPRGMQAGATEHDTTRNVISRERMTGNLDSDPPPRFQGIDGPWPCIPAYEHSTFVMQLLRCMRRATFLPACTCPSTTESALAPCTLPYTLRPT